MALSPAERLDLADQHRAAVELASQLLVAEAASGRWQTGDPGAEVAVRARMAYRTAQAFLAALDDLKPEGLRRLPADWPRPPPTSGHSR